MDHHQHGSSSGSGRGGGNQLAPPRIELESGQRWVVENFYARQDHPIRLDDLESRHAVCLREIRDSTVVLEKKVNTISLERCKNVGLMFHGAIACLEAVHCSGLKVESRGGIPLYQIDQCDGCTVYLTEGCLDAQIITSLSTEVNVVVLPSEEALDSGTEEPQELMVPEQFVTTLKRKPGTIPPQYFVETTPVQHAGA